MTGRTEIIGPTITGNARLALGYVMAWLMVQRPSSPIDDERIYRPLGIDKETNSIELEHIRNGNRYRLTLVQIAGVE